jgi:ribonuclease BN (tRNA processing enzyme)
LSGPVTVTFAGSGDAFGSGGRLQACIMLADGERRVLLDCGATSLSGLKRLGVEPNTIDAVVVSHLHGDHFGGLPFLFLDGQFSRRETDIHVIGPPGTAERLTTAMEVFFPGSSGVRRRFAVEVTELAPGETVTAGPWTVHAFAADHASGAPSLILRLESPRAVVAYSGDTAWTPALIDASHEADLFICEAYFHSRQAPYHLSYDELAQHLGRLTCKRVILTHMTAEMLAAEGIAPERAEDGLVVTL